MDEDGDMLNPYFKSRSLADAGVGIRFSTKLFERDLYVRLDLPFYVYDDDGNTSDISFNNWVFSFQRSL